MMDMHINIVTFVFKGGYIYRYIRNDCQFS